MEYLAVHDKWRHYWREHETNKFNPNSKKQKYYCLEMFPYPSAATLHVGHFFKYAPPDTHARFKRMCGFEVFQPMGFDSFGLPSENHALKTGTHPIDNTEKNIVKMRDQLDQMGGMYDWDYEITTSLPNYYKWTQWLFLQLYKAGLAYQKEAPVNWCDKCKTVLANEQVVGGACERCDTDVLRRNMKQWFFKITDYAEDLLKGLEKLDWPNKTKVMQRNWIGKSTGAKIWFDDIEVFTTRPDTIYGATFMVLAPEHALVPKYVTKEHKETCGQYIKAAAKKSDVERLSDDKQKTGVFTGGYVRNPINGEKIPVWIADYVLATYGTGAIMAVPAHDERDEQFAKKYKLPIKHVVDGECEEYKKKIITELKKIKKGEAAITYRLRDWSIGRQRYFGAPIPIIYCSKCGTVPVPEKDLPIILPYINDFAPKGAAPLEAVADFVNCTCPKCGHAAKRECDTMDTFVCSAWYYLRYPDAKNDVEPFSNANVKKYFPVDRYIGGAEHACMHLLYVRFINQFLHKNGLVPFKEPFPSLVHQGMILARDGTKMSKSKGNTITPDEYVDKHGSDNLRLYMLFGFNYFDGGPWDDKTLKSVMRFPERIEKYILNFKKSPSFNKDVRETNKELLHAMAVATHRVREDLEGFSFNTAVARCMELLNTMGTIITDSKDSIKTLVLLMAPMIPHIAEEYWEMLGEKPSIFNQPFPIADEKYLHRDQVEIAVQINSKIVARITVANNAPQSDVEKACTEILAGKQIKKVVYIANRLVNFII